jgi:hypothetical protein
MSVGVHKPVSMHCGVNEVGSKLALSRRRRARSISICHNIHTLQPFSSCRRMRRTKAIILPLARSAASPLCAGVPVRGDSA